MPHSTLSPKPRLSRHQRDVQDCVDAYLRLSEASGWHSVGSTSVAVEVGKKWGKSYTDERYEAAEEGMYTSPELRALFASWSNPTPKTPFPRIPFDAQSRATVWDMTGGACWYCDIQTNPFRDFTIDHVIPVSKGGTDDLANLVPCCKSCNSKKGAR